jgi:Polyketide cyclase / dehydrase and lipid transport
MPAVVASTEVERPAAEVFAYATDPTRFSEWQKGVVEGHMDGPGNGIQVPAVGAKCVTTRRIGGANRPATSELVHIDPPRTWGVRGLDGPIRAAVDVVVQPVTDARSRLTISVDFSGRGIGKVLVPLVVRRQARKEMPDNLAALKRRMEAR